MGLEIETKNPDSRYFGQLQVERYAKYARISNEENSKARGRDAEIQKQYGPVLKHLKDSRVFELNWHDKDQDNNVVFTEKCDEVYCAVLTKEGMLQLAKEIQQIAESMK